MNTYEVISLAKEYLSRLAGHDFDVIEISRPVSSDAAVNLAKIISKLSPLVGNLIEFNTCEFLNDQPEFIHNGHWIRQDPGFPDTIFIGDTTPTPGFEIKAWFPLATEITARFKDSQNYFIDDQTYVALLAWLPEYVIFGKPKIIDIVCISGASIAKSRDTHYHNPPDYLVIEPGDTSARTANLQQTNTNGYKFQGTMEQAQVAEGIVASWGPDGTTYIPTQEYQEKLRELMNKFPYRLDTNYAKMDRIENALIEEFKRKVLNTTIKGKTVDQWRRILSYGQDEVIRASLEECFKFDNGNTPVIEETH